MINNDGRLDKSSMAEWIHMSTEGGTRIPLSLLRDLSAIIINLNSSKGVAGVATAIVEDNYEHQIDTHPHDLTMDLFKDDIVEKLYLEYREQGYSGTRVDMLHALLQIIPIAGVYEYNTNDDTKAVPVRIGKMVNLEHESSLLSHTNLLLRGTPAQVLLAPPTISLYGTYMDRVYYEQFHAGSRLEIDMIDGIWAEEGGTIVVSYEMHSDDGDYFSLINTTGSDVLRMFKFGDHLSVSTPSSDIGYDSLWHTPHTPGLQRKIAISYTKEGVLFRTNTDSCWVQRTLDMNVVRLSLPQAWISKRLSSFVYYPIYISDTDLLTDLIN